MGVDWGLQRLWCVAAQAFQSRIINTSYYDHHAASVMDLTGSKHNYFYNNHHYSDLSKRAVSCALITGENTVRHYHKEDKMMKFRDINVYKNRAKYMFQLYLKLFPNWYLLDTLANVDPLRNGVAMYGLKFVTINSSVEKCSP
jgi:hypothetical protein